jgi:hypothetical protein
MYSVNSKLVLCVCVCRFFDKASWRSVSLNISQKVHELKQTINMMFCFPFTHSRIERIKTKFKESYCEANALKSNRKADSKSYKRLVSVLRAGLDSCCQNIFLRRSLRGNATSFPYSKQINLWDRLDRSGDKKNGLMKEAGLWSDCQHHLDFHAGLRAGWSRAQVPAGPGKFFFRHSVQTGSEALDPPIQCVKGALFLGDKAAGAWSSPLTSN